MPLKTNLLADRSEVGLWQMTVSPTFNATVFTERHLPDGRLLGRKTEAAMPIQKLQEFLDGHDIENE